MCNQVTMDTQQLLDHIRELRVQKNSGEVDDKLSLENQKTKWRNRLEYIFLKSCIQHFSDEVRLEILGLIVESKKSTLFFTEAEFDLIRQFLTFNLGDRLEFVPLVKKAFKRVKESLAVFQRHVTQFEKFESCQREARYNLDLYEQLKEEYRQVAYESLNAIDYYCAFFQNIREICLSGICPGATHTRKKNCLRILHLQEEILSSEFKNSPWTQEQAGKLLQCLLLDTYESNKDIAFKILRNIEPCLLQLDNEEKVDEILDVALRLGNSIRPIDSITAAYMFKVCLLSPVIKNVLQRYSKIETLIENIDNDNDYDATLQLVIIVIEQLREPAKLASENIIAAAAKHSLYGYLFCIKSLLSTCNLQNAASNVHWVQTIDKLISLCLCLNHSVSEIVNNSSPEGHFPMDLDAKNLNGHFDEYENIQVTPQMVLLCAWRTVKEVSLLFGLLAKDCPIEGEEMKAGLLSRAQVVEIGNHLVTLLCETKHRGAFEQAHVGFEQLCKRLWQLKQESLNQLPKIWLYQLLLSITGLSPCNSKLCATRRSAGVPFMIQAIIVSEPSVCKKSGAQIFHATVKILLGLIEIAAEGELSQCAKNLLEGEEYFKNVQNLEDKKYASAINSASDGTRMTITEVKTHALNILRALFKHAQLGDLTKNYAADGLIAAIRSYDEKTWAERNAATLLYSALITRIFGVQRTKDHVNLTVHNKMTGRIFFEKYPKLLLFMLGELKNFIDSTDTLIKPSVQAILLVLSRLYVSFHFDSANINWRINEFVDLVSRCAKSRIYYTRELAARALVPLLTGKTVGPFMNGLFELLINASDRSVNLNLMHGYMLQIREIVKSSLLTATTIATIELENFILGCQWILEHLEINNNKPAAFSLATEFVDTLCKLMKIYDFWKNRKIFNTIINRLMMHNDVHGILKDRPGREIYEVSATTLLISLVELKLQQHETIEDAELLSTWGSILFHPNYQVQITGWTSAIRAIEQTSSAQLYQYTISLALKDINSAKINSDLYESICDFLYEIFMKSKSKIPPFYADDNLELLGKSILSAFQRKMPRESANFLKLLGKTFGTIIKSSEDTPKLILDLEGTVYEIFGEYSWTGAADSDCRIAMATVIYDIYFDIREAKRKCVSGILLDWWTAELNLLVDDNSQVRKLASVALSKVPPVSETKCDSYSLALFFEKFSQCFQNNGCAAFAAYFVWSLSLSDDDYDMDECDVFNKCYNYEIFEPLRISNLCGENLKALFDHYDILTKFPTDVQQWLSRRLGIDCFKCTDAYTLIHTYRDRIPSLSSKLSEILDPTYNDKLVHVLAFEKFATLAGANYNCITDSANSM